MHILKTVAHNLKKQYTTHTHSLEKTLVFIITLANLDQFSQFFHSCVPKKILYKRKILYLT